MRMPIGLWCGEGETSSQVYLVKRSDRAGIVRGEGHGIPPVRSRGSADPAAEELARWQPRRLARPQAGPDRIGKKRRGLSAGGSGIEHGAALEPRRRVRDARKECWCGAAADGAANICCEWCGGGGTAGEATAAAVVGRASSVGGSWHGSPTQRILDALSLAMGRSEAGSVICEHSSSTTTSHRRPSITGSRVAQHVAPKMG
eukprot:scaffold26962_cov114-Isochrysis_galbana.AAC.8